MEPIIISASFFQEQPSLGVLGRTGEHEARRISFDCGEVLKTWPEATILCICRRPCDTAAYPIPMTADGTTYTMPLMSRETAAAGTIKLELRAVRDDTVLKSAIFYGRILPSLNGQKDAPGNPLSDALNRLESTIANAQTLADEIRQKLDNGEFIGERGPQGEPGKDGADANVTAQNIEAALGYVPVTPSDLAAKQNVLTDADKQSITKIGMTTGAAWTAAEQKAARERMGVDKAYELIESITTDGTAIVEREAEPNGTPYNFSRAIVVITSPKNMESASTIFCYMAAGDKGLSSYALFQNNIAYFKRAMFLADVVNGIISYKSTDSMIAYADQQDQGSTDSGNLKQSPTLKFVSNNITRIKVHDIKFAGIPASFLIQIYGVRA